MKALKVLWLFFLFAGFLSCNKKEYPKSVVIENNAVFYSKLTIDNQPLELQAGVNGYYMYASHELDSNFVKTFVAELKQNDCSNCTNSLKIQIKDYLVSLSNATSNIDSSLHKGAYPILSGYPSPTYSLQFMAANDNTASWEWNFGDGTTASGQSPTHIFKSGAKHSICLTTTSTNNYKSSVCNKEDVTPEGLRTTISTSGRVGNSITFSSSVSGKGAPFQYLWNFGNGQTSTKNMETVNYTYGGAYPVSLRVVNFFGDTAYANYNAKTITDMSSSAANYTIFAINKINPKPPLSTVLITWTDANGLVYTSNSELQPTQNSFEVLSVNENERNQNGETTKKITAKFSCKLYNGSKSIDINNAEVVISVAY